MDSVTASLLQEAGVKRPDWSAVSAQGRAEQPGRDAMARTVVQAEGGVDPVAQSTQTQEQWSARLGGAAPDLDPITKSLLAEAQKGDQARADAKAKEIPGEIVIPPTGDDRKATWDPRGGPEALLTAGSGAIGALAGHVVGLARGLLPSNIGTAEGAREAQARAMEVMRSLTYVPRTAEGRETLSSVGKLAEETGLSRLAGIGPSEAITLGSVIAGPMTRAGVMEASKRPQLPNPPIPSPPATGTNYDIPTVVRRQQSANSPAPQPSASATAPSPPQAVGGASVGAAGASAGSQARAMAANASPELQQIVEKVADRLGPQGLKTLERHVDADALPVKMSLTEGQATGNPILISNELNERGAIPGMPARLAKQNEQLIENTHRIREKAAPDVFVTNKTEAGELLVDAYKAKDGAANADIGAKYKALENANGGSLPMDGIAFVDAADALLAQKMKSRFVPKGLRKTMEDIRANNGKMTFEQFEEMRTTLANIQRSNKDGNAKQAAALIRESLENMPLTPEAAPLKSLADTARAAARDRFKAIESDPAYAAVVNGDSSADKFIGKFVTGGDKAKVQIMRDNLAHDKTAQQAMAWGAIRELEEAAGIVHKNIFGQANFNRQLEGLRPKMQIIFGPEVSADLDRLGRVARYVKEQPAGSYVNNSNTLVGAIANAAASAVEWGGNALTFGKIPIGSMVRGGVEKVQADRTAKRVLAPGAGITLREAANGP